MRIGYIVDHRYQILRPLGEGGMANVYEAQDLVLQRKVTLKMLRLDLQDDPHAIARFKKEANLLTKLDNPHIVKIYDFGNEHGIPYLIMEYVKGMDLKSYLKKNYPLPFPQVVNIMEQILAAVKTAHQMGIIHRDLKPKNILIDNYGKIKVTDFGISIVTLDSTITKTNTMIGSVHYISPEQARGSIITKQSDIYSLGVILFELLTNRLPFEGKTAVSIAVKHYRDNFPSVRQFNPQVPQSLENIVFHATAKSLNDRYHNVDEMASDLKTALLPVRAHEPRWEIPAVNDEETKTLKLAHHFQKSPEISHKKKAKKHVKGLIYSSIILISIVLLLLLSIKVRVPDLAGMNVAEARQALISNGLKLGSQKYEYSNDYLKGQTIKSEPTKHTSLKRNSKVDILVSKGPQKVKFGSYVGQNYQAVKNKLTKKGVLVTENKVYSQKFPKGRIVDQNVDASSKVDLNKLAVTFAVSKGIQTYKLRDLIGYTQKSVEDYAEERNITVIFEQQYSSTCPKGEVIAQDPLPGTKVKSGDQIVIQLALGPQFQ